MALSASVLGAQLANLVPTNSEAEAITRFVDAWEAYFSLASVMGIPVNPGSLSSALSAMASTLVGWNAENMGSIKIQAGIISFWGVVATSSPSIWTTAPANTGATPPPGLSGISSALDAVFLSNRQSGLDLVPAALAVANAIHPLQLGGICILPVPPTGPGPQSIL